MYTSASCLPSRAVGRSSLPRRGLAPHSTPATAIVISGPASVLSASMHGAHASTAAWPSSSAPAGSSICRCATTVATVNAALMASPRSSVAKALPQSSTASVSSYDAEERIEDIDGEGALELGDRASGFNTTEGVHTLRWVRPAGTKRVTAPKNAVPIVICPGFGNFTGDYEAPFGVAEGSLANNLRARGFEHVYTIPIERKDWFRVARGLLTLKFWSGGLTTNPGYTWYLDKLDATVQQALEETGASQVDLVGHSAGGWLARAYIGDPKYMPQDYGSAVLSAASADSMDGGDDSSSTAQGKVPSPYVRRLVTLGTPQRPPPRDKMQDMTGGAQAWVDREYPGAFFAPQGLQYTCVAGRTVQGYREFDEQGKPKKQDGPRRVNQYGYDSYVQVCGEGQGVQGDAVVPLRSALLPGAQRIVLRGVYHSMSKIGTFDEASGVVWYGSDDVIDCWLGALAGNGAAAKPAAAVPAKPWWRVWEK